ncbi:MAG: enterochelin esterase domain-containing protein [Gemmatimonadaceae bacterium]
MIRSGFLMVFLLLAPHRASAQRQGQPGQTLQRLLAGVRAADTSTLRAFWDSVSARGTPMLDPVPGDSTRVLAEFVYRSTSIHNVILENGVNGWAYVLNQLEHVEGTDIWHITVAVPTTIRLGYVFRENDNLIPWHLEPNQGRRWATNRPDPFNAHMDSAQNRRSVLLGPDAVPDTWSISRTGVPAGKVEDLELQSGSFNASRTFAVYTPPGYSTKNLPLLIVFDGPVYRRTVRLPTILDNLIADRAIEPVVAVFIAQTNRMVELAPNEPFSNFVAKELIPFVRQRYGLSGDPQKRLPWVRATAGSPPSG